MDAYNAVEIAAVILFAVSAIAEFILSVTWNKYYFLHGIPIFTKKIEVADFGKAPARIDYFIKHIDKFEKFSKYTGFVLDKNTFFFRTKMITSRRNNYGEICGSITIDNENRVVIIKSCLHYSFFTGILFFLVFFWGNFESFLLNIISVLIFILIFGIINYLCERSSFKKLVNAITSSVDK